MCQLNSIWFIHRARLNLSTLHPFASGARIIRASYWVWKSQTHANPNKLQRKKRSKVKWNRFLCRNQQKRNKPLSNVMAFRITALQSFGNGALSPSLLLPFLVQRPFIHLVFLIASIDTLSRWPLIMQNVRQLNGRIRVTRRKSQFAIMYLYCRSIEKSLPFPSALDNNDHWFVSL